MLLYNYIGPQLFHLHASEVVVCINYFCRRQTITLELDLYIYAASNKHSMHACDLFRVSGGRNCFSLLDSCIVAVQGLWFSLVRIDLH